MTSTDPLRPIRPISSSCSQTNMCRLPCSLSPCTDFPGKFTINTSFLSRPHKKLYPGNIKRKQNRNTGNHYYQLQNGCFAMATKSTTKARLKKAHKQ